MSTTQTSALALDANVDHVRGAPDGHVILEYGDYECPYSRAAYRAIQRVEEAAGERVCFVFRHFPLTDIHPHALAAAEAAEAAALQTRFWEMSDVLFHHQKALTDRDVRAYAAELGLDLAMFDAARTGEPARARVRRDIASGVASRQVRGTPTLFIDGALHRGSYDTASLLAAVESRIRWAS